MASYLMDLALVGRGIACCHKEQMRGAASNDHNNAPEKAERRGVGYLPSKYAALLALDILIAGYRAILAPSRRVRHESAMHSRIRFWMCDPALISDQMEQYGHIARLCMVGAAYVVL